MLLQAHSGSRYLVLLMGIIVIGYAAYGMATSQEYDKRMRGLSAGFTGALDLTIMLGFANLLFGVGFYPQLGGHIVMMVFAATVAHVVHGIMKRRPDDQKSFAPHLIGALVALACVAGGIMALGKPIVG
jgi:hypothetical protein